MTKRYVVPEGMLEAAGEAIDAEFGSPSSALFTKRARVLLEAALGWLAENLPHRRLSTGTLAEKEIYSAGYEDAIADIRRMFLAPEDEVPEGLRKLFTMSDAYSDHSPDSPSYPRDLILEAYRLGQQSREGK